MYIVKNETTGTLLPMTVTEGVTVNVLPNAQHEYLMTTKEVANGYGTTNYAIQKALYRNGSELIETKHYVTAWTICPRELLNSLNLPHNTVFWTKRGVVRLGLFIKSERAKLFRDWAEELVVAVDGYSSGVCPSGVARTTQGMLFDDDEAPKQLPKKRLINRLDRDRMVRLLVMTAQINDNDLRRSIVNELTGGFDYGKI